jgi:phosphinothricin acetyltransferase
MIWIDCNRDHLEAIRAIFNEAIVNSTALYDYIPRSVEVMQAWFETKEKADLPVIGVMNEAGGLMGFGSYGPFRPSAARVRAAGATSLSCSGGGLLRARCSA